ncbi:MAG: type II-A CRISPR-associated protein Csn2 [Peptococcaceae bacterium]|nr:type II-A CRISPR-associated protein Csn2 [Peptococcaceae bacterium]
MKLLYHEYGLEWTLRENTVHRLIIEHPQVYGDFLQTLYDQCDGEDGDIVLMEGAKSLSFKKKVALILEPFSLKFDAANLMKALYEELSGIVTEEQHTEYTMLRSELQRFMNLAMQKLPYPMDFNDEPALKDFFKFMNLRFDYAYETLAEKLCGYLSLLAQLCHIQVAFLVDCDKYLTAAELALLQETLQYHKIILIQIEDRQRSEILPEESCCIIDHDFCIIHNNPEELL